MELNGHICSGCSRTFVGDGACPTCGRRDGLEAVALSGRGTVYSFSRVHVPTPRFEANAPYVLALVQLEEGARVTAQVATDTPDDLKIDAPVQFDRDNEGTLVFTPAAS